MKVLHCIGFHDSRLYYRTNYYLEELARSHTCQPLMLTGDLSFPHIGQKKERIRRDEPALSYGLRRERAFFHLRDAVAFRTSKAIRDFRPDIAHLYEGRQFAPYLAARTCVRLGIPFVYEPEQRSDGSSLAGRAWSRLVARPWIRFLAEKSALIRVVTPGALEYLNQVCGRDLSAKTVLVTLAYNERDFFPDADLRKAFRAREGLADGLIGVGLTGKFSPQKKIEAAIEGFKRAANGRMRLFIQGAFESGYREKILAACAGDPKISVRDGLLDRRRLNEFYNGMDYLLWTSPTNSFFEALGTDTKIIVPFGDATRHLISENIIFYGDGDCVEKGLGMLSDTGAGAVAIAKALGGLGPYAKTDGGKECFSARGITRELFEEYSRIISSGGSSQ